MNTGSTLSDTPPIAQALNTGIAAQTIHFRKASFVVEVLTESCMTGSYSNRRVVHY